MTVRGILVREAFIGETIPALRLMRVQREYPHEIEGIGKITIVEVSLARPELGNVVFELAHHMKPRQFYCHFVEVHMLVVILPSTVMLIPRDDFEAAFRCQMLGVTLGIPLSQMQFLRMFDEDHPDA